MNELINKKIELLFTPNEINTLMMFKDFEAQWNLIKKEKENELKEIFKENNIDYFDNEYMHISYVKPHKRKTVDTKKMKDEGIYDLYLKESDVKDSIKIDIKYV